MPYRTLAIFLGTALSCVPATAQTPDLVGEYRLNEGPEAGGGLRISDDGRFQYGLSVGSLDERAEGRWERRGDAICLFTEPKPVPPEFTKAAAKAIDGATPTILVTLPNGRGIPGVRFIIGFDNGDPVDHYTQVDGWTMPADDARVPRWVELRESTYNITAPRFELTAADQGRLHAHLIPNDIGIVDFAGACLRASGEGATLDRGDGKMRFVRRGDE